VKAKKKIPALDFSPNEMFRGVAGDRPVNAGFLKSLRVRAAPANFDLTNGR
jgi:hypothetical protein